ncbi:MAG: hypothetical protein OSJ54_12945 [Oscillospiraceae bacterium]|nr:hypothetical protein [Oscillospiraceae bacterium]
MSEIKTQVVRSEREISSQNLVVRNYSEQLKSAVISDLRRKEILKKMRSELTAQQFHRPEIRSAENTVKNVAAIHSSDSLQTSVNNDFIHTQRHTDYIRKAKVSYSEDVKSVIAASENLEGKIQSADKIFRRKAILRNMQIKQMRLKNKRYTVAKSDDDNLLSESAELVRSSADTVIQAGEAFKNTVSVATNGINSIRSMVKNGVKVGTKKDIGKIFTAVGGGIKNVASDAGNQLLKTKIDKSKITDTGTETIKQGITEIRYLDNTRKAVLNTARTTAKAAIAVKNTPRDIRVQVKKIKKNVKRTKDAAVKVFTVIHKALTSKVGIIILLALAVILMLVLLINGLVTLVSAAITSLFSWLISEDEDKSSEDIMDDYSTAIVEYIEEKQSEIDEIVEGFVCDTRQYPPYDEITELNQYGNKDIADIDENSVLAILAVIRYRDLQKDNENSDDEEEEIKFEFTDDEIQEVIDKFYDFEYHYEYGNCHYPYCKCKTEVTIYNEGTPYEYTVESTEYYCDVQHQWLYGEVTNYTVQNVMDEYNFTDEEKDLYEMYLAQIRSMTGDDDNI